MPRKKNAKKDSAYSKGIYREYCYDTIFGEVQGKQNNFIAMIHAKLEKVKFPKRIDPPGGDQKVSETQCNATIFLVAALTIAKQLTRSQLEHIKVQTTLDIWYKEIFGGLGTLFTFRDLITDRSPKIEQLYDALSDYSEDAESILESARQKVLSVENLQKLTSNQEVPQEKLSTAPSLKNKLSELEDKQDKKAEEDEESRSAIEVLNLLKAQKEKNNTQPISTRTRAMSAMTPLFKTKQLTESEQDAQKNITQSVADHTRSKDVQSGINQPVAYYTRSKKVVRN